MGTLFCADVNARDSPDGPAPTCEGSVSGSIMSKFKTYYQNRSGRVRMVHDWLMGVVRRTSTTWCYFYTPIVRVICMSDSESVFSSANIRIRWFVTMCRRNLLPQGLNVVSGGRSVLRRLVQQYVYQTRLVYHIRVHGSKLHHKHLGLSNGTLLYY